MVAQNTMRAVQFRSYGAPEVLKVGAVEIPSPGPKEVVVEVAAFSVNAVDLLTRRGKMRLLDGMGFPKGTGVDFAGLVHAVGDQVGKPVLGRRVWGYLGMRPPGRTAAGAQYVRVRYDRLAPAPDGVPLAEAAALPLAGLTAVQALRPLELRRGNRVLVVGGKRWRRFHGGSGSPHRGRRGGCRRRRPQRCGSQRWGAASLQLPRSEAVGYSRALRRRHRHCGRRCARLPKAAQARRAHDGHCSRGLLGYRHVYALAGADNPDGVGKTEREGPGVARCAGGLRGAQAADRLNLSA